MWDDERQKPKPALMVGDDLGSVSIAELVARISTLESEIARIKAEIERKRKHSRAADELFKGS